MATSVRSSGPQVSARRFVALILAFLLLSVTGGVLLAGLAMPLAAGANTATDNAVRVFDELPADLEPGPVAQMSKMYASDHKTVLANFYTENRIVKPLSEISPAMLHAVISVEDKRFYQHGALDVEGLPSAIADNVFRDENRGASSITQQYVKNVLIEKALREDDSIALLEAREDSLARKAREAKLAISLEKRMTKNEILEGYVNIAQFGTKVYGVEAAAHHYFNVAAKDLNYLQAATIAGITRAPAKYDPTVDPDKAQTRRNTVLQTMYAEGYITQEEYDTGRKTPIAETLNVQPITLGCQAAAGAAFFCDYVAKTITSSPSFGETKEERQALLYRGGLTIYTTLDIAKQRAAESATVRAVPINDPSGLETALVAVEPATGKILAMAQNRPYDPSKTPAPGSTAVNYSSDRKHGGSGGFSPGSTFKVFVLTQWLKEGHSLYDSVNADIRTWNTRNFHSSCGGTSIAPWTVRNSDGQGHGNVSVLTATANSINSAYVSMESRLDLCAVGKTAWDVGFRPSMRSETSVEVVPAMVLGTQNTSPLAQANAYATFASGGIYCDPIAITRVVGADGKDMAIPTAGCKRVLDVATANTVSHALQQVMTQGSGRAARPADGRPVAGKTGTAQASRHTWFIGYTPNLVAGVWVGNAEFDQPHMNVVVNGKRYSPLFGSSVAAPEWKVFMDAVLPGVPRQNFGAPNWGKVNGPVVPKEEKPKDDGAAAGADR